MLIREITANPVSAPATDKFIRKARGEIGTILPGVVRQFLKNQLTGNILVKLALVYLMYSDGKDVYELAKNKNASDNNWQYTILDIAADVWGLALKNPWTQLALFAVQIERLAYGQMYTDENGLPVSLERDLINHRDETLTLLAQMHKSIAKEIYKGIKSFLTRFNKAMQDTYSNPEYAAMMEQVK